MDIVFDKLVKRYGEKTVYDGFSITFRSGEVTALMGPSGCGKTTLLNILARLTTADGGRVTETACAYVFQTPRLLPNLTAKENLMYAGASPERAAELLRLVETEDVYPKAMSGGMAQRVGLARAFIQGAPVLLMDEPFKSLDVGLKYRLMQLSKDLIKRHSSTVIMVTHDVDEAEFSADRAVVIDRGRAVYDAYKSGGRFPGLTEALVAL